MVKTFNHAFSTFYILASLKMFMGYYINVTTLLFHNLVISLIVNHAVGNLALGINEEADKRPSCSVMSAYREVRPCFLVVDWLVAVRSIIFKPPKSLHRWCRWPPGPTPAWGTIISGWCWGMEDWISEGVATQKFLRFQDTVQHPCTYVQH